MEDEIQKAVEEELRLIMQELIRAYEAKGMRASGNWANSLQIEINGTVGKITGLQYTEQLQYGRRPGGFPPIEQIERWVQDKGIQAVEADITTRQLAFLIARKIAREGWKRERFGGVELVTDVLTPQRVQRALNNISQAGAGEIIAELQSAFIRTLI